ncbi:hypothetical protein [Vagococcus hydrophili]|nr:hypothetical protein [Vagococcus hydrophili]
MPEVIVFLLFVSVGLSLWVIFYGKKVKNKNGKQRKSGSKKRD